MPLHATPIDPILAASLKLGSGFFWTLTYILIIRRGLIDKRYGMPVIALCANISWEFIFSFIFPHKPPQLYVDYVWFFFDLGILIQYLYWGKKDFPLNLNRNLFYPAFVISLVLCYLMIIMISHEFDEYEGIYAAFGQNIMMSVLFIYLLLKRNDPAGQSLYIALFKMIGTIIPSVLFYLYYPNSCLLTFMYFAILLFDLVYFVLLYSKIKRLPALKAKQSNMGFMYH